MFKKREEGLLSLEASISLTIFIFLMLFMYSFFVFFEARNAMAHTLLATAQSLSLDAYEKGKAIDDENIISLVKQLYYVVVSEDSSFVSAGELTGDNVESQVKERFIAYLADGDVAKANKILKRYNIDGGVDGLDFSESTYEGDKLKIVLKYKIEYEFQVFALDGHEMKQSVCSKTW